MTKGQRWSRVFVVHILDFIYRRNGGSGALASTRIPVRLCRLHLGFLDWAALQPEPDPRCKERPERGKVQERLQQRKRQHVKNMIEEQKNNFSFLYEILGKKLWKNPVSSGYFCSLFVSKNKTKIFLCCNERSKFCRII